MKIQTKSTRFFLFNDFEGYHWNQIVVISHFLWFFINNFGSRNFVAQCCEQWMRSDVVYTIIISAIFTVLGANIFCVQVKQVCQLTSVLDILTKQLIAGRKFQSDIFAKIFWFYFRHKYCIKMDGQALDWQSANFRQTVVEKM